MSVAVNADVLGQVRRIVQDTIKISAERLDLDAEFVELGIDSIIAMELMEGLSRHFAINFTPAQFLNVATVRELAAYIEGLAPAAAAAAPAVEAPRVAETAAPADPLRALLDSVKQRHAIDLTGRRFDTLDQIVDEMVEHHLDHWLPRLPEHTAQPAAHSAAGADEVAIVGLSCRFPDAPDAAAFWDNLIAGRNSIREIPAERWDWRAIYAERPAPGKSISKWGALIEDADRFDAAFFGLSAQEARLIDPQERLLLQEAYRALQDAGVDPARLAGSATGVFVGYEYAEYEQYLRRNMEHLPGLVCSSSSPSYYLANRLSYLFDLRGPSESVNVNCASSALAIHRACRSLIDGESELALAGAACLHLFGDDYVTASQYGLLSPDGRCAVFDDGANGFTRGEGVGVVVLKRLDRARADGDRIYATIKTSRLRNRGRGASLSEVKFDAIADAVGGCYAQAGLSPAQIDYVELNGYAKKWADSFEFEGLRQVFAAAPAGKTCALGSLKGNIGHLEPANGVAGLIKLALSMHHRAFPPTITRQRPSSFIDLDDAAHPLYLAERRIGFDEIRRAPGTPVRAGLSSFADSGVNVHLLVEEYLESAVPAAASVAAAQLLVLSARDGERLRAAADELAAFLEREPAPALDAVARTLQCGREAMRHRLAFAAADTAQAAALLRRFASSEDHAAAWAGLQREGLYRGDAADDRAHPLSGLIGADMAALALQQGRTDGNWSAAAQLWAHGVAMPWQRLWPDAAPRTLSLPGYAFARERHWMDLPETGVASADEVASAPAPTPAVAAIASAPRWRFARAGSEGAAGEVATAAPADKLERFLRQEIATRTGADAERLDAGADLIALGLDSMAIAELIAGLGDLLGLALPPSLLFRYPQPRQLALHLAELHPHAADVAMWADDAAPAAANEPIADDSDGEATGETRTIDHAARLVPMRAGEGAPWLLLPGADGSVLSLRLLAQALDDGRPVFGFDAAGLDGAALPSNLEQAAADNLAALRAAGLRGPYRLLGYSNGGVLGFEMTRQLAGQGEPPEALVLLDSVCPPQRTRSEAQLTAATFAHLLAGLGGRAAIDADALAAMDEAARGEHLYALIAAQGLQLSRDYFMATYRVAAASERLCRAYTVPALPAEVRVGLVRALQGYPEAPADYGWNAHLPAPLRRIDVDCDHYTAIEAGAVEAVADAVRRCLQAAAPAKAPRGRAVAARSGGPAKRRQRGDDALAAEAD
ncbi:beta-ketoacyl synthase N-terminal-like domain-containing protein [Lysobacter enzymogenes]|uniref:Modular polyketide synthase n=1 Tax=Lysobacter enzymogenes TaxID=69 RepID=A0AAU9AFU2_LYSEN|nr:beta-ketoacyl synthase N-terminal-like domain-containing protein [Lysobacter enzymogenes]BAV98092.1 modular polyketide synthase [Lysobacter enzymogenes]